MQTPAPGLTANNETASVCGLDIGGANIKVALPNQHVQSFPFPLWKQKEELGPFLETLLEIIPIDQRLAITMTGELADCFKNRSEGVRFIVDAVAYHSRDRVCRFYSTNGNWLTADEAIDHWLRVAAANWHAIATYASRFLDSKTGFLIDIGSTTTDIIPIINGVPIASGSDDFGRLAAGELVYVGMRRTPICGLCNSFQISGRTIPIAREFFATIEDAMVVAGKREPTHHCETADGRPATIEYAAQRLARMVCIDKDLLATDELQQIANQTIGAANRLITNALRTVVQRHNDLPHSFVVSGEGECFAESILNDYFATNHPTAEVEIVRLSDKTSIDASVGAAAVAVSKLASEVKSRQLADQLPVSHTVTKSNNRQMRVIKIGGSLLNWAPAKVHIQQWLGKQTPATNIWIVGGGGLVDCVRQWGQQNNLAEETAHWICVDLLSITHRLVKTWFPTWTATDSLQSLEQFAEQFALQKTASDQSENESQNILFDPGVWWRTTDLPQNCKTTSDSCAAHLTQQLTNSNLFDASELVLLKSTICQETDSNLESLVDSGLVDNNFPKFINGIDVMRVVNLRSVNCSETILVDHVDITHR